MIRSSASKIRYLPNLIAILGPEEMTMGDNDEECLQTPVGDKTFWKIKFAVEHSVIGIVKAINEDSIEKYCDFIERNYPVDSVDWLALKSEMTVAARKGPKIFVKCPRGKMTGYKKITNRNI